MSPPKKKVLYTLDTLQTGGAERSILEIASRLRSWEPIVCQIYAKSELQKEYAHTNIRFVSFDLPGTYQFWKAIKLLRRLLREEKPDLVVATLMRTELISRVACFLEKVPLVGTFVNDTYSPFEFKTASFDLKLKIRFFQFWNALTARVCTGFLSNSEYIKQSNAKALFINPVNIKVIHRGRTIEDFQKRSHFSNTQIIFVNVGRLIARKGQKELIEAFSEFVKIYPKSQLKIAGEGPYRPVLEQTIRELNLENDVILLGNVKDIPALLETASAFVFPSHYEGFSGALVEAALAGVPIIASDIPMNKEVTPEGCASFFEVKKKESIWESLVYFAENTEEFLLKAEKAMNYAVKNFDIENIAFQHEKAYDEFLKNARKL